MLGFSTPIYAHIVIQVLTVIKELLNDFVFNGYNALSDYLRVPLAVIASIYIAMLGYCILYGWVKMTMGNFVKAVLKIAFIYVAVTQWSFVSEYLVNFVNSICGELTDALLAAAPLHIPGADGVPGALQITLVQFTKIGSTLFDSGGFSSIGGWIGGIVVWGFGWLTVGIGLFEIILAQVMLAILFVFTPLIVIFCFFKPFHGIFDRWLGNIVGFALLQLFVMSALSLALSLCYWWSSAHYAEQALQIGNYGMLPVVIIGLISIGLIWKAAELAQSIGGDVRSLSSTGLLAGMVGGFLGSSLGVLRSGPAGALGKSAAKAGLAIGKGADSALFDGAVGKSVSVVRKALRGG